MVVLVGFALAACGQTTTTTAPTAASAPTEAAMVKPTEVAMANPTSDAMVKPTDAAMVKPTDAAMVKPTDAAMVKPTDAAMVKPTDAAMVKPTEGAAANRPAWQQVALTDAVTGKSFTLADFAGRTVYVEPMATWCSNCRQQLGNVKEAKAQLNSDDVVFVALSVETNLAAADLASYASEAGFDWTFAVATPELLQELTAAFGRTIANPPSTPHFIIRPDGTTSELATGIEPAANIIAALKAGQ
jgi:thiol-disulfide isomerase/thioredoxin